MLRSFEINADNYVESVRQMRAIADSTETSSEAMVIRKTATTIEKFMESSATEEELEALSYLNQELDSKRVLVYADTIEGAVEYEYMLTAKDGNNYERNELSSRSNFPLLTEDEIYTRAEEVRLKRDEYSESGDYWEDPEAEEDYDLW